MRKNKLIAYGLILFTLLIPLNFSFLSMDDHQGSISLIMMILIQFAVLGALIIGVDKK